MNQPDLGLTEEPNDELQSAINALLEIVGELPTEEKILAINAVKIRLHEVSPFSQEPVDCVTWVKNDRVFANDYNPNSVAPTEMKLLELSILQDGYTQPIVTMPSENCFEVVDGFHRNRVGKESKDVSARVLGYLPVVRIKADRTEKQDRMAATIRHNRARGAHRIDSMSEIVVELKRRNWNDEKIAKELGMDADEVLRLCQISGLAEVFKDREFSTAWEIDNEEG
jgi:ParB-like chromosome segregation protein Spo0J